MFEDQDIENSLNQLNQSPIKTNNLKTSNNFLEPFKVYVRIRPFLSREISKFKRNNSASLLVSKNNEYIKIHPDSILTVYDNKILYVEDIKRKKNDKKYEFDHIFTEKNNNNDVFNYSIKPMISNILNGYNSTALAYGVTGTGKTHTIFGNLVLPNGEEGITIKAINYLFEQLNNTYFEDENIVKVSYIEIYNENVIDLLNNNPNSLYIVEDEIKGVYCPNAQEYIVNNYNDLKNIIFKGNKKRTMASTNQNNFSSRSHAILIISLERKHFNKNFNNFDVYYSKFLVVDLAGSERGGQEKGKRRKEGANINKSLYTLGSCINILADKSKYGKFIPYRDSKLTRLLKDSLGGNILTVMLVCVSPSNLTYDETISSLNYATRAKKIQKKIVRNVKELKFEGNVDNNNNQNRDLIFSLQSEISQLKNIIKNQQMKLTKNINNNDTLNLEDETVIKNMKLVNKNNSNGNLEVFFDDVSELSSIKMVNNSNLNENNNTHIIENAELISKIKNINLEKYENLFEDLKNKDVNISLIQKEIDQIKNDKNILEIFLEQNNINFNEKINESNGSESISENNNNINNNTEKIYLKIKKYYDKFIEIINDKLLNNIEQTMVLKYNIKEITELNKNNKNNLEILLKQMNNPNIKSKTDFNNQINNIKQALEDNSRLKKEIIENFNKNINNKKILKSILLNLLENKKENNNKLANILKEKEKLAEKNKEYKKKIQNFVKIQKQKENDIIEVQKQVEILRAQLKEKEKKIFELKKNKINNNNNYDDSFYVKKTNNNKCKSCIKSYNCNNNYNLFNKNKKPKVYTYYLDMSNEKVAKNQKKEKHMQKGISHAHLNKGENTHSKTKKLNHCLSVEMKKNKNIFIFDNKSINNSIKNDNGMQKLKKSSNICNKSENKNKFFTDEEYQQITNAITKINEQNNLKYLNMRNNKDLHSEKHFRNSTNNFKNIEDSYFDYLNLSNNNNQKTTNENDFKKLSLYEARYEQKVKKIHRNNTYELNKDAAESFIKTYKAMNINQINNLKKINKNNTTVNLDNRNCQVETKENDMTDYKTNQSKILKTDDFVNDLVKLNKNFQINNKKEQK